MSAGADGSGESRRLADSGEGVLYAMAFMQRICRETATPGELAMLVQFLDGQLLHDFCACLQAALQVAARQPLPSE